MDLFFIQSSVKSINKHNLQLFLSISQKICFNNHFPFIMKRLSNFITHPHALKHGSLPQSIYPPLSKINKCLDMMGVHNDGSSVCAEW